MAVPSLSMSPNARSILIERQSQCRRETARIEGYID